MLKKALFYEDFIPWIEKMKNYMENERKKGKIKMLDSRGLDCFIQKVFQKEEGVWIDDYDQS